MSKNKLIIAAAGSGKTTCLVKEALKLKEGRVLITTYTQANEAEIRKKIIEINKCIPKHITVQTWFSFLLKHGVRPFQPVLFEKKIKGLLLVNSQSGLKYKMKTGIPVYFKENGEFEDHYFTKGTKIYSDKLSKFVQRCNEKTDGAVIDRLTRIYSSIFIDEVQDLAGYDLEILKSLFKSACMVLMVCDPRQGTYSTNTTSKHMKFRKSDILSFLQISSHKIDTDETSLVVNYRSNPDICNFSNQLFPEYPETTSGNKSITGHDGVFFVKNCDIDSYLSRYKPMQLRDSVRMQVNKAYQVMNFGESKGLAFDRVLIYPTKPMIEWILNHSKELLPTSLSKLYVAITRARYSVSIVYDFDLSTRISGVENFVSK